MAYTLAQLKAEAIRWLDAHNDPNFELSFPGFVRQAEERIYGAARIQPFRQIGTENLSIGEYVFPMPQNYVGTIAMSVSGYGGLPEQYGLLQKNTDYLIEAIPRGTTGRPIFYAIQGPDANCTVAPIPAAPTDLIFEYYGKPPSLSEVPAGTTTWVSRNAETTLLQGTLYYAYLSEKGEDDMTAKYLAEFDKGLLLLLNIARGLMRKDDYRSSPQASVE